MFARTRDLNSPRTSFSYSPFYIAKSFVSKFEYFIKPSQRPLLGDITSPSQLPLFHSPTITQNKVSMCVTRSTLTKLMTLLRVKVQCALVHAFFSSLFMEIFTKCCKVVFYRNSERVLQKVYSSCHCRVAARNCLDLVYFLVKSYVLCVYIYPL